MSRTKNWLIKNTELGGDGPDLDPEYVDPNDPYGDYQESFQLNALRPKTKLERYVLNVVGVKRFRNVAERKEFKKLVPVGRSSEDDLRREWIEYVASHVPERTTLAVIMARIGDKAAYLRAAPELTKKLRRKLRQEDVDKMGE